MPRAIFAPTPSRRLCGWLHPRPNPHRHPLHLFASFLRHLPPSKRKVLEHDSHGHTVPFVQPHVFPKLFHTQRPTKRRGGGVPKPSAKKSRGNAHDRCSPRYVHVYLAIYLNRSLQDVAHWLLFHARIIERSVMFTSFFSAKVSSKVHEGGMGLLTMESVQRILRQGSRVTPLFGVACSRASFL